MHTIETLMVQLDAYTDTFMGYGDSQARAAMQSALQEVLAERDSAMALNSSLHDKCVALIAERDRLRTTIYTDNTQTVVNAEREIERLTGLLNDALHQRNDWMRKTEEQDAEIERLKEDESDMHKAWQASQAEVERLNALVMDTATQYNKALQATQLDLENERRKVTELVAGYEKDTATIKELRAQLITTIGQQIYASPDKVAVLQAIARGWCSPKNSGKIMDCNLALAIQEEVMALLASGAAPNVYTNPQDLDTSQERVQKDNRTAHERAVDAAWKVFVKHGEPND